jgi:hypothetical protein
MIAGKAESFASLFGRSVWRFSGTARKLAHCREYRQAAGVISACYQGAAKNKAVGHAGTNGFVLVYPMMPDEH